MTNEQDKLNKINKTLNDICTVLEMRFRQNGPHSLYFPNQDMWDEEGFNVKDFEDLKKNEIRAFIVSTFRPLFQQNRKKILACEKEINKIQKNSSKKKKQLQKQLKELKDSREDLKEELKKAKENPRKLYEKNDRFTEENIKKRWANLSNNDRKAYGSLEKYKKFELHKKKYIERSKKRKKVSDAIAKSGYGDTRFGKGAQTVIGASQSVDDIKMFNQKLQNGGAETIAQAIVGNKGSGVCASAIRNVGDVASKSSGKMTVLAFAVTVAMGGLKLLGKALSAVANYRTAKLESYENVANATYEYNTSKITASGEKKVTDITASGAITLKKIETSGENMLDRLRIETMKYSKAHSVAASYMFDGISKAAYSAAETMLDVKGEMQKLGAKQQMRSEQLQHQQAASGATMKAAQERYDAAMDLALQQYNSTVAVERFNQNILETERYIAKELDKRYGSKFRTFDEMDKQINGYEQRARENPNAVSVKAPKIDKYAESTENIFTTKETIQKEAQGSYQKEKESAVAALKFQTNADLREQRLYSTKKELNASLAEQEASLLQGIRDAISSYTAQRAEIIIDAEIQKDKAWLKFAENIENFVTDFDKKTNVAGLNLGIVRPERLYEYKMSMFGVAKQIALKFNKSIEDILQQQEIYTDTSKRNIAFTKDDYENITALGKLIEDDNLAAEYAARMELFNKSVKTSVVNLGNLLGRSLNNALNAKALSKGIVDNMTMAEKYSFKNGTNGYLEFVRWAFNNRMKVEEVGKMLESFQNNSIDEMFTRSTEFQVLGGMAEKYSNPFGLIFDLWVDPESFAKRMQLMTNGVGRINKITGETDFSVPDNMYLNQLAKLQYRSLDELKRSIMHNNKRDAIKRFVRKNNLDGIINDSNIEYVTNKAFYNQDKQKWAINVETKEGKFVQKTFDELTAEDLEKRAPDELGEQIVYYLERLVTVSEQETGAETAMKLDLGSGTFDTVMEELRARTDKANKTYEEQRQVYIDNAVEAMTAATEAFEGYIDEWKKGNAAIDLETKKLEVIAANLAEELGKVAYDVMLAEKALESIGGIASRTAQPYGVPTGDAFVRFSEGDLIFMMYEGHFNGSGKAYQYWDLISQHDDWYRKEHFSNNTSEIQDEGDNYYLTEKGAEELTKYARSNPSTYDANYNPPSAEQPYVYDAGQSSPSMPETEKFREATNQGSSNSNNAYTPPTPAPPPPSIDYSDAYANGHGSILDAVVGSTVKYFNDGNNSIKPLKQNKSYNTEYYSGRNTEVKVRVATNIDVKANNVRWDNIQDSYIKTRMLSQEISNQMTKNEYGGKDFMFIDRFNR